MDFIITRERFVLAEYGEDAIGEATNAIKSEHQRNAEQNRQPSL